MEKNEATSILKRIKAHYPDFSLDGDTTEEWWKELKKYEFTEVSESLNEHLKGEYGRSQPKLYLLIKHLLTIDGKASLEIKDVQCNQCKKWMKFTNYNKHYSRCLRITTLYRKAKRLGKDITREEIENYDESLLMKLEEKYVPEIKDISLILKAL